MHPGGTGQALIPVAVVNAGGGSSQQGTSGNTITVTFHPTPTLHGTTTRPR